MSPLQNLHDLSVPYAVANQDIAFESFDGDVVVVDLGNGKYYSFSDGGSAVWESLMAGVAPAELVTTSSFGGEIPAFLATICDYGLLVPRPEVAPVPLSASLADQVSRAKEPPDVSVFDDMADLFVADPIHDVEEPEGWPAVKRA
ncbi:PqqD family protein [Aquibium microcysteis]|uniref:PqqD family protein n=1 Tax=Aquibium microcysteis TaxID=675281 RepID=UPI00165D08BE|nr:PqqD family protein [Aquibium microcysteis]